MLFWYFIRRIHSEPVKYSDSTLSYSLYENKTAAVLGKSGNEKTINLTIPENIYYNGSKYTVTSICDDSFRNSLIYGTLSLPNSLLYIGKYAFAKTDLLQYDDKEVGITGELIIPASVIEIKEVAFYNSSITSLKILSNNIKVISESAFSYCSISGELILPESILTIGDLSFFNTNITNVILPKSLEYIGYAAFGVDYANTNSGFGLSCDLIIPDSVTQIGTYAFYNTSIKTIVFGKGITIVSDFMLMYSSLSGEVILPDSITEIGDYAFANTNISSIIFSSNLKIIGIRAFRVSRETRNTGKVLCCDLIIPDSVNIIETEAFCNTSIKTLTLGKGLKTINSYAFAFSSVSGEIFFPEALDTIQYAAFANANISKINFLSSLKYIGDWAFGIDDTTYISSRGLTCDIVIPDSVTYLGAGSFHNTSIKSLTIGKGITVINEYTFCQCVFLMNEIIIPDNIIAINGSAFINSSIPSIKFGNNLSYIGDLAFGYCSHLRCEIKLPESLTYIGRLCFYRTRIQGVVDGSRLSYIGDYSFMGTRISGFIFPYRLVSVSEGVFQKSSLSGEIVLPETVKEIKDYAFGYTQIGKINFPAMLQKIGYQAFIGCENLENSDADIRVDFIGVNAFAFSSFSAQMFTSKNISNFAFYNCKSLTGYLIIYSDYIGESAFEGCTNIETLKITLNSSIEKHSFEYCTSLKSVEFQSTEGKVLHVGEEALAYCSSLEEIILPKEIETIRRRAFCMCSSYSGNFDFSSYTNLDSIGNEAYFGCNKLFGELKFPDSLTTIGNGTFTGCAITGSLIIPDGVNKIGPYAFFKCTELSGIISIGNNVEEISDSVFALCSNIAGNIILGNRLRIIGERSFFGCSSLTGNLIIPESVTEIRSSAFYDCHSLTGRLILPNSLTIIGENAFAECQGFTSRLTIPSAVTSIGKNAFFNCHGFEDVVFENSSIAVEVFAFSNMHIKCFSNPPDNITTNDPEIYSSDNFKGKVLPKSHLNFDCTTFYAVDTFLAILVGIISSSTMLAFLLFIYKKIAAMKTNVSIYKEIFNEIIVNKKSEKEIHDDEIAERITNSINARLEKDSTDSGFNATKRQLVKALERSLDETWPTLAINSRRYILEKSFNDIEFKCSCNKCGDKCSKCSKKESKSGCEMEEIEKDKNVFTTLV